jgi:hypothetical protein
MASKEEYLKQYGIEPTARAQAPAPTAQAVLFGNDAIAKKREELELKKLEIELSKLEKPDTSIDYYSKMLELQQQHFQQVLQMSQEQGNLKLEIEKLKLMETSDSDDFMPLVKSLLPLLPSILANKNQIPASKPKVNNAGTKKAAVESPPAASIQEAKKEEQMKTPETAGELQEYIDAIKSGEITYEEALEDFRASPYANMMNEEQFKAKFEQIIQSKTI